MSMALLRLGPVIVIVSTTWFHSFGMLEYVQQTSYTKQAYCKVETAAIVGFMETRHAERFDPKPPNDWATSAAVAWS